MVFFRRSTIPVAGFVAALACGDGEWGDGSDGTCGPQKPCADLLRCSAAGKCIREGTCLVDGDCDPGMLCDGQRQCAPASSRCGKAVAVPPDLLFVLDRSCSMQPALGETTKWGAAVEATVGLIESYRDRLRFGLILFPDTEKPNCGQEVTQVPPGESSADAVKNLLQAALDPTDPFFPDGPCVTNVDTAIERASMELSATAGARQGFVLLLTDGVQSESCGGAAGDAQTEGTIAGLFARGVPTFVVGFTSKSDKAQLSRFATAGGRPNDDPDIDYYPAEDQTGLSAVFETIARSTLECTFSLDYAPPCSADVRVFFRNGEGFQEVIEGGPDGWSLDPNALKITFSGIACNTLTKGLTTEAHVVYGLDCGSVCPERS